MSAFVMENESVDAYRRYFETLQGTEHTKNALITTLLSRLEHLEEKYEATKMDYDREMQYNRQGQVKEQQMAKELKEIRTEAKRDPFVLVLLDGDGMIFDDSMLERGEEGGRDAANDLWSQTREYIKEVKPDIPPHYKIVTRVYANLKGLGDVCYRSGMITRPTTIEDFARGFTGSKQLFDFVDVGAGKDRADEKITETLKLFLRNQSCQLVIFGGSHDNGYTRLLEDIPQSDRPQITLLEGVPFERELRGISRFFDTVKYDDLFRTTKIPTQPFHRAITNESDIETVNPSTANNGKIATDKAALVNDNNNLGSTNSSPRTGNVLPAKAGQSATWAGKVTLAPSPPPDAMRNQVPKSTAPAEIPRNKFGQRIDPQLSVPDIAERQRVGKIKMCNVHFLQHACPYGDGCTHDHSYRPTKSELDILRYMNRLIPCRNGPSCDEPFCMYGHRCQRSLEGMKRCSFGSSCRFAPEMHGIDTRVVKTTTV